LCWNNLRLIRPSVNARAWKSQRDSRCHFDRWQFNEQMRQFRMANDQCPFADDIERAAECHDPAVYARKAPR